MGHRDTLLCDTTYRNATTARSAPTRKRPPLSKRLRSSRVFGNFGPHVRLRHRQRFLSRTILYLPDSKGENTPLSFNQPAILIRVNFGGCAAYCMALQVDP